MATLLKVWGMVWLSVGLWVLWRAVAGLSRVREAVHPVGSPLVGQEVLSAALIFVLPGLAALILGVILSPRRPA